MSDDWKGINNWFVRSKNIREFLRAIKKLNTLILLREEEKIKMKRIAQIHYFHQIIADKEIEKMSCNNYNYDVGEIWVHSNNTRHFFGSSSHGDIFTFKITVYKAHLAQMSQMIWVLDFKLIWNNFSFKIIFLASRIFFLPEALKSDFSYAKMFMWHFCRPPAPLL